ncbi:MAG: DUF5684 domain-containing protein [Candidatus Geothermincolia bacterium]
MYTTTTQIMLGIMALAVYAYSAICFQRIARSLEVRHPWFAWIPILNVYLVCRIIGKRYVYTVLCFIPIVNIVMYILIGFKLSRACGKGRVMGLLLLIPLVNLVALWVLVVKMEGAPKKAPVEPGAGDSLPESVG